jgi:hypothetical protein
MQREFGPPKQSSPGSDDAAEWAEFQKELLTTGELMEIHEYLNATGETSV